MIISLPQSLAVARYVSCTISALNVHFVFNISILMSFIWLIMNRVLIFNHLHAGNYLTMRGIFFETLFCLYDYTEARIHTGAGREGLIPR